MANQMNVNKYRMCFHMSLDTAAKLRTYVKGMKAASEPIGGRNVIKKYRDMTVGDLLENEANRIANGVHADAESIAWMRDQLERNVAKRRKMDEKVRSGAYRKPKSEWLKPGRKPGKDYGGVRSR